MTIIAEFRRQTVVHEDLLRQCCDCLSAIVYATSGKFHPGKRKQVSGNNVSFKYPVWLLYNNEGRADLWTNVASYQRLLLFAVRVCPAIDWFRTDINLARLLWEVLKKHYTYIYILRHSWFSELATTTYVCYGLTLLTSLLVCGWLEVPSLSLYEQSIHSWYWLVWHAIPYSLPAMVIALGW